MRKHLRIKHPIALFVALSLLAHVFVIYVLALSGDITLSMPVSPVPAVIVSFKEVANLPQSTKKSSHGSPQRKMLPLPQDEENVREPVDKTLPEDTQRTKAEQSTAEVTEREPAAAVPQGASKTTELTSNTPVAREYDQYRGPVRNSDDFLATKKETLTYRISLLKVPVGNAVIEATNINGELRITLRIMSNSVFSAIYPVDDLVETRMIKGNYLLTRVRQKEGAFRSDFGFTLMLREHKAFWIDRLTNRFNYQPLPVDDVMDAVSGFYFLRNQDLEVGKPVQLHLFDSNEYAPTTVDVLRREQLDLRNGERVSTLVVHPQFTTAGFFRRTGDITIWLTDDRFHVPVRVETSITLGKVVVELISSESEQRKFLPDATLPGK